MAQTNTKPSGGNVGKTSTRNGQYYDYNLLACVVLSLTCFGLIMLYSTSAYDAQVEYGSDTYFLPASIVQRWWIGSDFIFSMIDYHFYARYAGYFYLFSNLLLLATKSHRSRGKRCKTMDQNWSDPVSVSRTCQTGDHSVPFCTGSCSSAKS